MAIGREDRGCRKDRGPAATPSAHGHRNCLGTTPAADQKRLVLRDTTGAAFGSLNVPSVQAVEVIAARGVSAADLAVKSEQPVGDLDRDRCLARRSGALVQRAVAPDPPAGSRYC